MYAALALCVPLPALAGGGGGSDGGFGVEAVLGECSAEASLVCEVTVSFDRLPDADGYAVRVISPGGTVREFGTVAGAGAGHVSTGLTVPYSGSGMYTFVVSAWANGEAGDELVDDERDAPEEVEEGGEASEQDASNEPSEPGPSEPSTGDSTLEGSSTGSESEESEESEEPGSGDEEEPEPQEPSGNDPPASG